MAYEYPKPNKSEFKRVCDELEEGAYLDFTHVGRVFGPAFYEMLVMALMDANDASRAIQGAINRLRRGEAVEGEEVH